MEGKIKAKSPYVMQTMRFVHLVLSYLFLRLLATKTNRETQPYDSISKSKPVKLVRRSILGAENKKELSFIDPHNMDSA